MRTSEENHKLHQDLWNWLSYNPGSEKSEWPRWKEFEGSEAYESTCFACEEANIRIDKHCKSLNLSLFDTARLYICDLCPINWGESFKYCNDLGTAYNIWEEHMNTDAACTIANLPWSPRPE